MLDYRYVNYLREDMSNPDATPNSLISADSSPDCRTKT